MQTYYKTGVFNDPLGHTHSLASSEHCFHMKFVFVLLEWEKWEQTDGQTDGRKQ